MSSTTAEKRVPTVIHLSPLLRRLVEQSAAENERSLSAEVRLMLGRAYSEHVADGERQ